MKPCLNPYSIGRYSLRQLKNRRKIPPNSLNPYSIGRYSLRRFTQSRKSLKFTVLILILLEDTLWGCSGTWRTVRVPYRLNPYSIGRYSLSNNCAIKSIFYSCLNPYSIGRYSLRRRKRSSRISWTGLNPYSTGRYSLITCSLSWILWCNWVLILILLEDTLWDWC